MTTQHSVSLTLVVGICSAACAVDDQHEDAIDDEFATPDKADAIGITEGSPDALAILRLVNHASYQALDDVISSTAARNIVAYRRGADATIGTADDRVFTKLVELDAIPYVGPYTLRYLHAEAREQYLPTWNTLAAEAGAQITIPVEVIACTSPNWEPGLDQCEPPVATTKSGLFRITERIPTSLFSAGELAPCLGTVVPHTGAFAVSCYADGISMDRSLYQSEHHVTGMITDKLLVDAYTYDYRSGNQALGFRATHRRLPAPISIDPSKP